jgi:glutamine amidotransferase-like uncharacterized protein
MRSRLKHSENSLKVACLTGQHISSDSLLKELETTFGEENVHEIRSHHLHANTLKSYDLLALPGIIGEKSPYPHILTPQRASHLKQVLRDGLIVWSECAATHQMFDYFEHLRKNGELVREKGLGLIKGLSIGPAFKHLTRDPETAHRYSDIVLARLSYTKAGGMERLAHIFNINGPALYPESADTGIIARYADIEGTPAAGVVQKIGKGLIVALAVHPAFSSHHLPCDLRLKTDEEEHLSTLFEKASAHDRARLDFFSALLDTVHSHAKGLHTHAEPA